MQIAMKQEITLRPELELELQQRAEVILDLNSQKAMIELALDNERAALALAHKELGTDDAVIIGEYRLTLVKPQSSRMTAASLLAAGVSSQQIAAAKQKIPGKPYVKVTRATDKEVIEHADE